MRWVWPGRLFPDGEAQPATTCATGVHTWHRVSTTFVLGAPVDVEYRCAHCPAWTVELIDLPPLRW